MLLPFFDALLSSDANTALANSSLGGALGIFGVPSSYLFESISVILVVTLIFYGILRTYLVWYQTKFVHDIGHQLSNLGMATILAQNYTWHTGRDSSELIAINQNMLVVIGAFLNPLVQLVVSTLLGLFIFGSLLVILGYSVFVMFVFLALIYIIISWTFNNRVSSISDSLREVQPARIRAIQQSLGNIKEIIISADQDKYLGYFRSADRQFMADRASLVFYAMAPRYVIEATILIALIISAIYVGVQAGGVVEYLPIISTLAIATLRLLPLCQQVYSSFLAVKGSQGIVQQLVELLLLGKDKIVSGYAQEVPQHKDIVIEQLGFRYGQGGAVGFENLNIKIERGDFVGISGGSGAGKTTFINLLMGLLFPTEGKILVNGTQLEAENILAWRQKIAHVPQDIFLFDSSILFNI